MEFMKHLVRADDPGDVLTHLMTEYGKDVWNYAFTIARSADAADEITQDAFLKAYRSLERFEGRSSPKTWLLTIARNTAYTHLRSAWVRKVFAAASPRPSARQRSAEGEALGRMEADRIWSLVLSLKPAYREALILDAHHGLSEEQIAAVLGVSRGTVKSRLHRARAAMERLLQGGEDA